MVTHATVKVNLESLIAEEELKQLKDIRVKTVPKKLDQIGEGAYGKVYVFQFDDGSFRAGKKPRISLFNKSAEEERQIKKHLTHALREMKLLHQLNHERIIGFFGFYLDQSQIIIFMEVMQGSVKDEIIKKGYLSEIEAMNYITQAAEGLVYLHSRKPKAIVHRDIKCENLLLTTEKNVKLADFGLAVDLAISSGSVSLSSNAPTTFAGTQYFIAPEAIGKMDQPEAYGRKSDIWSLACTLVQMITGRDDAEPSAADAQCQLGYDYYIGRDVTQSDEDAVEWFRRSAEQGPGKACLNQMKKLSNGTENQLNKEMQMGSIASEFCTNMGKVCLNQMKRLSNGTEEQQNKEMQMGNLTLDKHMDMVEACLNQMKKLSNGTPKPLNKEMQMRSLIWEIYVELE
uniref:Protein kinase domain-containing protein n=1 Tax=Plectus sambesii TaxID=2011161 RepID=A0A914WU18_9BILA